MKDFCRKILEQGQYLHLPHLTFTIVLQCGFADVPTSSQSKLSHTFPYKLNILASAGRNLVQGRKCPSF